MINTIEFFMVFIIHFYVYQITNLINNKIYVGRHKSNKLPLENKYMGSGKLIKEAIKKHGVDNFKKEILFVGTCIGETANYEAIIVTGEFVSLHTTYNLHVGGFGGFDHINNDPIKRAEVSALASKYNKEANRGGTTDWTEESWQKVAKQAIKNTHTGLTTGWHHTDEFKIRKSEISIGERNSQYGKRSYTEISTGKKKKFTPETQPTGWELTIYVQEQQMRYSKRWYNDCVRNYYITLPNPIIESLKLIKGRLKKLH